jgi:hypothetical protein
MDILVYSSLTACNLKDGDDGLPCLERQRSQLSADLWARMARDLAKARFLADFTVGFANGLTVLTAALSSLGRTDGHGAVCVCRRDL